MVVCERLLGTNGKGWDVSEVVLIPIFIYEEEWSGHHYSVLLPPSTLYGLSFIF